MKPSIQYLKDRQKAIYDSHNLYQVEQNGLLDEIMDIRIQMVKLQVELNDIQIAIEKLERPE